MGIEDAYKTSGKIFAQVSQRQQPGLYQQLKAIGPGEIVVVEGVHDHVEKLLDTINIPYTMISSEEIKAHNGGRVMFLNCKEYGQVNKNTKESLESFVSEGGRLVSTDWAVGAIAQVFPGKLTKVAKTGNDVVEIQCHTDIARRLVGLNYAQCHPKWWLEGSSDIYKIGNEVTPIITSEEMEKKYGQPYVVAGFTHGKGEVLNFISHLELQRTELRSKADEAGLDEFVKKMKVEKTPDMDDAKVAELEAAYSTLNTLAYLCIKAPLLKTDMKSVTVESLVGSLALKKSRRLV